MSTNEIDITGLNKGLVLAALYNNSKVQGMGFLQAKDAVMTEADANELLKHDTYFDYLHGKVMKIDLKSDSTLYTGLYNRDIGDGAAERVIAELRAQS